MADVGGADIQVVVGADVGLSYQAMQEGLNNVISQINKTPPKIILNFNDAEINNRIASIRKQITDINKTKISLTLTGGIRDSVEAINTKINTLSEKVVNLAELVRVNIDSSSVDAARSQVEQLHRSMSTYNTSPISQEFNNIAHAAEDAGSSVRAATDNISAEMQVVSNDAAMLSGRLKEIQVTNSTITSSYKSVQKSLGGTASTGQNATELEAIKSKYIELQTAVDNLKKAKGVATQEEISNIYRLQAETENLISQSQRRMAIQQEFARVERETAELEAKSEEEITRQIEENAKREAKARQDAAKAAQKASNDKIKSEQNETVMLRKAYTLLTQIEQAEKNWTKSRSGVTSGNYADLQNYAGSLKLLINQYKTGAIDAQTFASKFHSINAGFIESSNTIRAASENTKTLQERIGALGQKFSTWFGISRVIMMVYTTIRRMVSATIELDNSMTQLQIVTKDTDDTMQSFAESAANISKEIGASITDFISSTTTFARLGYNLDESSQLAKFTSMLQNVGDIEASDAQDAITSIVKAFDIDTNQIESVMDKLVTTGNNFPISVQQIAEGMTNASSSLAAAGNSYEQSVALLAAANTTLQDASKASTGLRTIAARIRNTKTELDDLGEVMTEANYEDIVKQLTDFNVALTDANGEYRSTYDIMADIAAKWDSMTSMEQAALADALAGTRQQAVFFSIVGQFKEASGAMDAMANSAGALESAYSTYMGSATAHINQFKAAFQDFSSNLLTSGLIITITDIGTAIVNLLNTLQKLHLLLPSIAASVGIIKGIKIAKTIAESSAKVQVLSAGLITQKRVTDELHTSVALLNLKEQEKLALTIQDAVASGTLQKEEAEQMLTTLGLVGADGALITANKGLAASFKSVMASIPVWGWIALGISMVIEGINLFSNSVETATDTTESRINELNNDLKQSQSEVQQLADEFTNLKSSSDETIPRFVELARGVNEFGENVSLTDEEYSEFLSLNNQIAEMFPELNLGMDINGNAMLSLSYHADTLSESLYSLVEAYRAAAYSEQSEKMPEILEKTIEKTDILKAQIEQLDEEKKDLEESEIEIGSSIKDKNLKRFWDLPVTSLDQAEKEAENLINRMNSLYGITGKLFSIDPKGEIFTATIDWNYGNGDIDTSKSSELFGELIDAKTKEINDAQKRIQAAWRGIMPSINAWLQTDNIYNQLNEGMQDIAIKMVSGLDFSSLGLETKEEITDYISDNILTPLFLSSDETKEAFSKLTDWQDQLKDGEITLGEFETYVKEAFYSLRDSLPDEEVSGFIDKFVAGYNAMNFEGENFDSVVNSIISGLAGINDSGASNVAILTDLSEAADKLKSRYDILSTAIDEMNSGDGLSASTIKSLADETEDYIDYLYEENGIIKLNTKAWKEYSEAPMKDSITALEEERKKLISQRNDIAEQLRTKERQAGVMGTLGSPDEGAIDKINEYKKELDECTSKIKENQTQIELYNALFDNLNPNEENSYEAVLDNFEELNSFITSMSDSLTTVADIQEAVANGFTISLEKALEFAKVYPEILNGATVAANGQISLNQDVLSSFISNKQEEIKAQIDSKVASLEADKETLKAKKEFSEVQLKLAKNVGDGEGEISKSVAEYKINAGNTAAESLIEAGIDEASAYKLACEAMAGNVNEFNKIAMQVCIDTEGNFDTAAYEAAQSIYENMNNAKTDIRSVAVQSYETGKVMRQSFDRTKSISDLSQYDASLFNLNPFGGIVSGSSGGVKKNSYSMSTSSGNFKGVDFSYTPKSSNIDKLIQNITLDISNYNKAISAINGQISALKALRDTELEKFSTSHKQKSETSGTGSSSGKEDTWFDKEYNRHKHLVNMDKETTKDYLTWLDSAYKKAYNQGIIDIDEYYKYEEEVYSGLKNLSEEGISWFEELYNVHKHRLSMDAEENEDYLKWLDSAYKRAYKEGLINIDDYYKYQEEVYEGLKDLFKDYLNDIEHEISMRGEYEGEAKNIYSLYTQLMNQTEKEIRSARSRGLDDTDDYIQELQSKWMDYKNSREQITQDLKDTAKSAMDELINIRIDMIKQEISDEKDAINKRLEYLKDFYQEQKDMLQDNYDNEKYLEEQSEKRKAVSDVQEKIDQLKYDDSAKAQKLKLELAEELAEKQKELSDFEKDRALEETQEQFDKIYEKQEEKLNKQIELLEKKENNPKALYDQALKDIRNGSVSLYNEMIRWNNAYGDGISETIKTAWEEAYKALKEYTDFYGSHYNSINLSNATGYRTSSDSWYNAPVSNTSKNVHTQSTSTTTSKKSQNSSNKNTATTNNNSSKKTNTTNKNNSNNNSSKVTLKKGTEITVKKTATNFSNKSNNLKMAPFVPGGKYTVYQVSGSEVLIGKNGSYTGWIKKSDIVGYASGTAGATPGIHAINEKGYETIFESSDGTRYKLFTGGEKVLNADASNFLYEFANKGKKVIENILNFAMGNNSVMDKVYPSNNAQIRMGDIIIQGNADRQTVSEIRREQRESLKNLLKEFNKLK